MNPLLLRGLAEAPLLCLRSRRRVRTHLNRFIRFSTTRGHNRHSDRQDSHRPRNIGNNRPHLCILCTRSINQSINQSCFFRVVQVTNSLQDPLEVGNSLPGISDNVREWCLEQKCFRRWRKVDRDGADITLSGRLFQIVGPATGKARPPTVDSFTGGTSRRLVRAERRERRPVMMRCGPVNT